MRARVEAERDVTTVRDGEGHRFHDHPTRQSYLPERPTRAGRLSFVCGQEIELWQHQQISQLLLGWRILLYRICLVAHVDREALRAGRHEARGIVEASGISSRLLRDQLSAREIDHEIDREHGAVVRRRDPATLVSMVLVSRSRDAQMPRGAQRVDASVRRHGRVDEHLRLPYDSRIDGALCAEAISGETAERKTISPVRPRSLVTCALLNGLGWMTIQLGRRRGDQ